MKTLLGKSVLLVLAWQTTVYAQRLGFDRRAVDRAVMAEMQSQNIVGVALGVIRKGRVVYTQGYGFSNVEDQIPVRSTTVFNWASNSKPIMAVAALQLAEAGQLDLDKSIQVYLPDLPVSLKEITTRHLLCHQSGIPHYSNGKIVSTEKNVAIEDQVDPTEAINRFINSPLLFQPGSKTEYSSYAYILLSAVVQAAGKEKIKEQLARRIIKPLRLKSFQLDVPYEGQQNWTLAYRITLKGAPKRLNDTAHFWKHGAGGYKSDVREFAIWGAALMNSRLIDPATTQRMWTPQRTSKGNVSSYGLGITVSGKGKSLKVSHNGSQDETKTRLVLYPNARHGMVIMCNTSDAKPGLITTAAYRAISDN